MTESIEINTLVTKIHRILSKHGLNPIGIGISFKFSTRDFEELPFNISTIIDYQDSKIISTSGQSQDVGWNTIIYKLESEDV